MATPRQKNTPATPAPTAIDARRRRGRPYRLPDDPTPIHAPVAGLHQRIAWLLGVSRIHGSQVGSTRRERFIDELKSLGIAADTSRISRWESGRAPVPGSVLDAYERILGLTRGQLVSAAAGTLGSSEHVPIRPEALDIDSIHAHQLLDELFEEVFGGAAAGHTWMNLCALLTRDRDLYLLPDTWAQVSERLTDELGRSSGLAYVSRFEALRMLVRHPASQRPAVKAVGALVTNPAIEFVVHPLSLLQEVEDPNATALLLRLLDDAPGHLRSGSAWALAGKVVRGHFAGEELERLHVASLEMLQHSRTSTHRLDALAIHAALPLESDRRLTSASLDDDIRAALALARLHAEHVEPEVALSVSTTLAERVQDETVTAHPVDPDLMLRRLTRELLFHVSHERRYQAALLIAVSPYRPRMADELLRLAQGRDEHTAALAMTALFQIADQRQRATLLTMGLEDRRPPMRITSLLTLGQVVGQLTEPEMDALVARARRRGPWGRAALQVLGMAGATLLTEPSLDISHGAAATWWRSRTAIVEPIASA